MKKILLFLLFTNAVVALLISKNYLLLQNNLKNNGSWQATKVNLEMGVMGAWNFFSQTQPLNGEKLNLGSWHGFQEVITTNKYLFDEISLKAVFKEKAT